MKTEVPKHSRPARTPPSTFLFLHLHLSNSPGPKPLSLIREGRQPLIRRQMTTGGPVVLALIKMRSLTGAKTRLGQGPKQRRAQWPGYRPAQSALSTTIVNKTSQRVLILRRRQNPFILRLCAVLEPQSCDVLAYYVSTESSDASGGCRHSNLVRDRRFSNMPVAFS
jgi:hypothetical protein